LLTCRKCYAGQTEDIAVTASYAERESRPSVCSSGRPCAGRKTWTEAKGFCLSQELDFAAIAYLSSIY